MKIALLTPGGVERGGEGRVIPCLLWLIEHLGDDGHEVHVFVPRQEIQRGTWQLAGATVHNAGERPWQLRMLQDLRSEHRRAPFDVIHAFWTALGAVGAIAGKLLDAPLVVTLPGGDLVSLPDIRYGGRYSLAGRSYLRIAASSARRITVPSEFMRKLSADLGIETTTVPLGVSLKHWPPSPPRKRVTASPLLLLHVASLNRVKDQPTLLRALVILKSRGLRFELRVAGCDTLGGNIQRLAMDFGLGDNVQFLGLLPHSALRREYEWADLLVMTSLHEAGPMTMLEAALAGVPTVGTSVGHIADRSPNAALAVPISDASALADAIGVLAENEARRLDMATAAQEIAARYDAACTARSFAAIYREAGNA